MNCENYCSQQLLLHSFKRVFKSRKGSDICLGEGKAPKLGSQLHTAAPEPRNDSGSPETTCREAGSEAARRGQELLAGDGEAGGHWLAQETEGKYA